MSSYENMGSSEFSGEEDEGLMPEPKWWSVAVFRVSRYCGGPEEGGWYYDGGEPSLDVHHVQFSKIDTDHDAVLRYRDELEKLCKVWNKEEGLRSIYSVLGTVEYRAVITENNYPRAFPEVTPHYE